MRKIGIGRTAEVFLDERGRAVKLFYGWMPETEATHEAVILQKVSHVCKLAPQFFELCRIEGRNGLIFEFIDGKMAGELMLKSPFGSFDLCRAMGALHHEIHSAAGDGLRHGEEMFIEALQEYDGIDADARKSLLGFVTSRKSKSLCHGDFHPENILIDGNGQMRVIDWVCAYTGDPLSDVARTYYLMKYGKSPNKRSALESALEAVGKPLLAEAYLRGYFGKRKFPKQEFRRWLLINMINRMVREKISEEEEALRKAIAWLLKSSEARA